MSIVRRIVVDVLIEVDAVPPIAQWVLANEPLETRVVVSGAIEIEASSVEFAAGESKAVRRGRARYLSVAERLEGVPRLNRTGRISKGDAAPQGVGQKTACAGGVGTLEDFIDVAHQRIRGIGAADYFLHRIGSIVEKARRGAQNVLADAASQRIVSETCGRSRINLFQVMSRIP